MELKDVVCKLVGPIEPIGDSTLDECRYVNLQVMIALVEELFADINYVSTNRGSQEGSRDKAGKLADQFIRDTRDAYERID